MFCTQKINWYNMSTSEVQFSFLSKSHAVIFFHKLCKCTCLCYTIMNIIEFFKKNHSILMRRKREEYRLRQAGGNKTEDYIFLEF